MFLISQNVYRKNHFYVTILFTFLILLMINPFNFMAVGMWLSFGGTLGIVLFHQFLKRWIECKWKIKAKWARNLLGVVLVSFAAQILIVPIMIYCFNTISLTFFVSNLMIYFLIGPILAIGYVSVILGVFVPSIGSFLAIFEEFLVVLLFKIAEICSQLPFSKIYLPTPDFWILVLYYGLVAVGVCWFQKKKFRILRFTLGKGFRESFQKHGKKWVAGLGIVLLCFQIFRFVPQDLKIYFVDVGQR